MMVLVEIVSYSITPSTTRTKCSGDVWFKWFLLCQEFWIRFFFPFMKTSKIWQPPGICAQLCCIDDCRLKVNLKHDRERKWFRTSVSGNDSTSPLRTARSYRGLIIFIGKTLGHAA